MQTSDLRKFLGYINLSVGIGIISYHKDIKYILGILSILVGAYLLSLKDK